MKHMSKNLLLPAVLLACAYCVNPAGADDKKKIEKTNGEVDWQKLLGELRERFARSQDLTLQKTRIDRAYFELNADDPDQSPFLVFKGICLRTANDDEKAMKEFLRKDAKVPVPNIKFPVKIDDVEFHDTPVYKLQDAAVT